MVIGKADNKPLSKLKDENARKQNRRVEILFKPTQIEQILYSNVLRYFENKQMDSAFILLNKWINISEDQYKIYALFDPRITAIRNMQKWKVIEEKIRKSYLSYKKPELAFYWDSMYCVDQKYRSLDIIINGVGVFPEDKAELFPLLDSISFMNYETTNRNKALEMIEKTGYPKESEVGKRASDGAFYFLQHSGDTILMKKYLPIVEQNCKTGEEDWNHFALMYDRIENIGNRPQMYCTQFTKMENDTTNLYNYYRHFPQEIVNNARKKIGLPPITDFDKWIRVSGESLFIRKK